VLIRASPAGEVRVNGQDRGTTPVVLRDLPFGVYSITISRPGFVTATREVNLVPSQPVASLAIDLERGEPGAAPAPPTRPAETGAPAGVPPASTPGGAQRPTGASGSLFVVSSPSGARLLIDGQPYGTTPAAIPNLAEGTHRIRLALPGHQPWEGTAHVRANQRVRVEATLVQGSR